MRERFERAETFTGEALRRGINLYSPIVHNHALALKFNLPKEFAFWQRHNFAILAKASWLWVLDIPGVKESRGVSEECELANALGIPTITVREYV